MKRSAPFALVACLVALTGCEERPAASPAPDPAPVAAPDPAPPGPPRPDGPRRVALFVPHEDLFWIDFKAFMQAACDQLGLELRYYVAQNNRELMKDQVRQAATGPDRVDALVFQSFKQNGEDLLRIADGAEVPAFLVNTGVDEERCGKPRERLPRWLGTMVSDGVGSGDELAAMLTEQAKALGLVDDAGKVHMVAIAGIASDQGSRDRLTGLERAVRDRGDIVLHQVVPTDWSREDGRLKATALLERYPHAAVWWTASDPLALAAIEVLEAAGRKPGVDAVVGGFDWTAEALEAVRAGKMFTSLGGEFMAGGWVAVLLHDYLEGRDFAAKGLHFETLQRPITQANAAEYYEAITGAQWNRVDFRALANPGEGEAYVFDAVAALAKLAPR